MIKLFTFTITGLLALTACNGSTSTGEEENKPRISGTLNVPENRSAADSRTIELHYTVLKAKKSTNNHPIIFLQGGPGGAALAMAPLFENMPLRNDHDIILYDARGTGRSGAYCTDMGSAYFNIMLDNLTPEEEVAATLAASQQCSEELQQIGYDKKGYTSVENAADIEALRLHLNYDSLILFGGSYGTKLGLTYLREYQHASAAILMSYFPLEVNLYDNLLINFNRALETLITYCEDDESCKAKYPNVRRDLAEVRETLTTSPFVLNYDGRSATINLQDFNFLLHQMLYRRELAANIPAFILSFLRKDPQPLRNALRRVEQVIGSINAPVYWSIQAYEELPFSHINTNETIPLALFTADLEVQSRWHNYRAPVIENSPVASDVPILIVNGGFDPITPITNTAYSSGLSHAQIVPFNYDGHVIFNECFYSIASQFLSMQDVNAECAGDTSISFN